MKNVSINRIFSTFFVFNFIVFFGHSQEEIIKYEDDYIILRLTIENYFESKRVRDSIYYASDLYKNNKQDRVTLKYVERLKNLDTIHMMTFANQTLYTKFLKRDARYKREKTYKKFSKELEDILSKEEIENYNKLLYRNNYVWNPEEIKVEMVQYIEELDTDSDEFRMLLPQFKSKEIEKYEKLKKGLKGRIFTFTKPIYSKTKKIALISYSYASNNILCIYEMVDKNWVLKLILNENYLH